MVCSAWFLLFFLFWFTDGSYDVSGMPDPYMEQHDQMGAEMNPDNKPQISFDESLESGYSTPNSRNRRIIREIIVWAAAQGLLRDNMLLGNRRCVDVGFSGNGCLDVDNTGRFERWQILDHQWSPSNLAITLFARMVSTCAMDNCSIDAKSFPR